MDWHLCRPTRAAVCLIFFIAVSACSLFDSPERKLYSAVTAGNLQAVQDMLKRGPKIDVNWMPGEKSGPALVVAASFGEHEIARLLIARGAKPDLGSTLSGSPLSAAAYHGDIEMCKILIAAGANVNLRSGDYQWTPLETARYKGHTAVVEFLKSAGALQ